MSTVNIIVNTRFVGFHLWVDAPPKYNYLSHVHRHEFHVTMKVPVNEMNREIEFCELKWQLDYWLMEKYTDKITEDSCEMIAEKIARNFNAVYVRVMEDGENGAEYRTDNY